MSLATKAPISETRIGFTGVGFDVYERLIRATPRGRRYGWPMTGRT